MIVGHNTAFASLCACVRELTSFEYSPSLYPTSVIREALRRAIPMRKIGEPSAYRNTQTCGNNDRNGTSNAPISNQFKVTRAKSALTDLNHFNPSRPSSGDGTRKASRFFWARHAAPSSAGHFCSGGMPARCEDFFLSTLGSTHPPGMRRAQSALSTSGCLGFGAGEDTQIRPCQFLPAEFFCATNVGRFFLESETSCR